MDVTSTAILGSALQQFNNVATTLAPTVWYLQLGLGIFILVLGTLLWYLIGGLQTVGGQRRIRRHY